VLGFAAGALWLLICSAAGLLGVLVKGRHRDNVYSFARIFCGGVVRLMRWKLDVDAVRLAQFRPCVFVANHQSIMDIFVFGAVVPRKTVAVAKREISRIPLFGWFFVRSGNLVIDRGNSEAARRMLEVAAGRLRSEGLSVWFMPEGHRNATPTLMPFKTGAFRLAAAAGVAVVPVVAAPLESIVDTRRLLSRPGHLAISVLDPVPPPRDATEAGLASWAEDVRTAMQRERDRLAKRASEAT
jgi:1-acyl-sn-glycerol-3-phosphate acyltransferase